MSHKILIVIDLDHTLLQTSEFTEMLRLRFEQLGISRAVFNEKYELIRNCCQVDMDRFVQELPVADKDELQRTMHEVLRDNASSWLYEDAKPFIIRYKNNADILVLTQGDVELQNEKIEHVHLPKGIETKVTDGSKVDVIKDRIGDYEKVYYIDDKPQHIEEVKKAFPAVVTLLMQRPNDKPYAEEEMTCDCADHVITSLKINLQDYGVQPTK